MALHQIGAFTLDTRTLLLLREGEIVKTPMKTIEVLVALLNRRGDIVTKEELLEAAWPDSIVEEANLSVHIALLRKTLGEAAPIETVPKRGYRLRAPVVATVAITAGEQAGRDLVLRGRYFWNKFTRSSLVQATKSFNEAILANPSSGDAHSGLCDTLLMQGLFGFRSNRDVFVQAREQGEIAAQLGPQSAEAQASLAFASLFDRYDFKTASVALENARRLAPSRVEPHLWSALFHALKGDTVRALAFAKDATDLDPISLKAVVGSGFHLYLSQQFEPDVKALLQTLELEPEFAVAHWALGLAYDRLGQFDLAERSHRAAVLHSGVSPTMESNLARSLILGGNVEEGRSIAERLRREGLSNYRLATIEAALGENGHAIASLERALSSRDPWLVVLKVDPMLDPLRKNPRIDGIVKEVVRG